MNDLQKEFLKNKKVKKFDSYGSEHLEDNERVSKSYNSNRFNIIPMFENFDFNIVNKNIVIKLILHTNPSRNIKTIRYKYFDNSLNKFISIHEKTVREHLLKGKWEYIN